MTPSGGMNEFLGMAVAFDEALGRVEGKSDEDTISPSPHQE